MENYMKINYIDKKYVYLRENKKCFHCKKELKIGQVTLDHYEPRSLGGTYDYFNLVSSCKRCNTLKQSRLPKDIDEVHLVLFKRAVEDKKIISIKSNLSQKDFQTCTLRIRDVECRDGEGIASGEGLVMHIKENKVYRIEGKC
jgi:hypothetical protein